MKSTIKFLPLVFLLFFLGSCSESKKANAQTSSSFDVETMKPLIQELGKSWSRGLKEKDASIFLNLYDEKGHYIPDGEHAIHGNQNIADYWKAAFGFLTDIQLTMETLEGTKELLYETGHGIALFPNQTGGTDTLKYKYVNVWKRQKDGTYKVVIDTYNDIKQ